MTQVVLVYPHHILEEHPGFALGNDVVFVLVEDYLYFSQYSFHKQKLILHRASMKFYEEYLRNRGFKTVYLEQSGLKNSESILKVVASLKPTKLFTCELDDDWLFRAVGNVSKKLNCTLTYFESPLFVTPTHWADSFFGKTDKYFFTSFYIAQRKRMKVLVRDDKPSGGQWSFDHDNRKKIPNGLTLPPLWHPSENRYVTEAKEYVRRQFAENPGNGESCIYPVTFDDSRSWLNDFLQLRIQNFGEFEDAISSQSHFLFHSVLSPVLNTGLLPAQFVVDEVMSYSKSNPMPINSLEGFLRQVIGWREYVRIMYRREGRKQRTKNSWNHSRKIPASFWSGTTGIAPVDDVIIHVLKTGYTHHIQRLMVMGNFMFLCEFDPDEVYRWFMELFIDAYDWVMVPNVYAMSQNADDGAMMTKPYISSSNYVRKMSSHKKGEWSEIWDALYWRFTYKNQDRLTKNARLPFLRGQLQKLGDKKLAEYNTVAEKFLNSLL